MDYGFAPHKNSSRTAIEVGSGDFFPVLTLQEFADLYGIQNVPDEVAKHALQLAMDRTHIMLDEWLMQAIKDGAEKLSDVLDKTVAGENVLHVQYKRAVYCAAKADLLRDALSMDRKADAENSATSAAELIEHYERLATRAIANLMRMNVIGVHLI